MDIKLEPANVTKEVILKYVSEETLMEHYLGIPVKRGLFRSPLRQDNNPTCGFLRDKLGRLVFKDFNGSFYGDAFEVVRQIYRVSFIDALQIIANDFGIIEIPEFTKHPRRIEYSNKPFKDSGKSVIQITVKLFSKEELKWWKQYNITKQILNHFRVYSCKYVFVNGNFISESSKTDMIFAYYKDTVDNYDYFRIYFPNRRKFRFLSNWTSNMIQGSRQLPEDGNIVVITKSLKDVMTLYSFGISAIAPNSETLFLSDHQLDNLKVRYNHIVVLYDQDRAGKYNMAKIRHQHPELTYLVIPEELKAKDISDYCKRYGKDATKELINKVIKYYGW